MQDFLYIKSLEGAMFDEMFQFMENKIWDLPDWRRMKNELRNAFAALHLPEPRSAEYMQSGPGNLGVLFLHQAGCVVRIVENCLYPLYRHPNLMRPIGSIQLSGNVRLDIQYAGDCPVSMADIRKIDRRFSQTNLGVGDVQENNCCRLQSANLTFPEGVPVMFDPSGIYDLASMTSYIKQLLGWGTYTPRIFKADNPAHGRIIDFSPRHGEKPDDQDILFADLREKFKAMFHHAAADGEIKTDPKAVQAFWTAMIEATQQNRLRPSWMEAKSLSTARHRKLDMLSQNYADYLAAHNPAFAECGNG